MPHAVIKAEKDIATISDHQVYFSKKSPFFIYPTSSKCENFIIRAYQKDSKIVVRLDKTTYPLITDDVKEKVLEFSIELARQLNGKIIHHNLHENKKDCAIIKRYLLEAKRINEKGFNALLDNKDIVLEIGIGKGEFLCNVAKHSPDTTFVGFEIANESLSKATLRFSREGLRNIRVVNYDARYALDLFKPNSVVTVYVNFPEPWFKFKKIKHALLNVDTLKKIERILTAGGTVELLTDNLAYAVSVSTALEFQTKLKCSQKRCIETSSKSIDTYFERRWRRKKRTIYSVIYEKTCISQDLELGEISFPLEVKREYVLEGGLIFKILDIFENSSKQRIAEITFGRSLNPQHAYFGLTDNNRLYMLSQTIFLMDQDAANALKLTQI